MNTAAALFLAGLRRRGFAVSANATGVGVICEPASKLTEADRRAIRTHLAALTDLVRDALPWNPQPHWEPNWVWYDRLNDPDWYTAWREACRATASYEEGDEPCPQN